MATRKNQRILRAAERRALEFYEIQFYVAVPPHRLDPGWAIVRRPGGGSATVYWDRRARRWISRAYGTDGNRVGQGWSPTALETVADWVSNTAAYARLRREVAHHGAG